MWFWLAVLSSIIATVSVLLQKRMLGSMRTIIVLWALSAFPIPVLVLWVLAEGIPSVDSLFFIGTIGSAIVFTIGKIISLMVIKRSQLSQIIPLTVFSSLFTYLFGIVILSEILTMYAVAGILLVGVGTYFLNIPATFTFRDLGKPLKILLTNKLAYFYVFAMLFVGSSAILDKVGIIHSFPVRPAAALLAECIVMTVIMTVLLIRFERRWVSIVMKDFSVLSLAGVLYAIQGLMIFTAFARGPVALVTSVNRLQILFILLASIIFFREKPSRFVWIGSLFMIAGTVLIRFG